MFDNDYDHRWHKDCRSSFEGTIARSRPAAVTQANDKAGLTEVSQSNLRQHRVWCVLSLSLCFFLSQYDKCEKVKAEISQSMYVNIVFVIINAAMQCRGTVAMHENICNAGEHLQCRGTFAMQMGVCNILWGVWPTTAEMQFFPHRGSLCAWIGNV